MKKPQRNFVIEYKSGRRKTESKAPSSIWGDLDLKSVARDIETVLPPPSGDADIVANKPAMQPEVEAPATHVLHLNASSPTDIDEVKPSRHEDPATGDASTASDANKAREIAGNAAPKRQVRGPRIASRGPGKRGTGSQAAHRLPIIVGLTSHSVAATNTAWHPTMLGDSIHTFARAIANLFKHFLTENRPQPNSIDDTAEPP